MLKQTDTASYEWASRKQALEHADPATAARVQLLRLDHAPPGVLRGIEQFTGLGVLQVIVDTPLDLSPVCASLQDLWGVELELRASVTGEQALATLPAFSNLTLTGDAEHLPAAVATLAWERIGSPQDLRLVARGAAFVVDVTPLGALTSLEILVGERIVFGPRDISGEAFAALLAPRLKGLHSAYADEADKTRLADAWDARPPLPHDAVWEPGFFPYDRVRLDASIVDEPQGVWSQDPEDQSWILQLDLVPILGGNPDDGEVNYQAQTLVEEHLRGTHPKLAERVAYDTTAEALFLIISTDDRRDRDHIDQAVRAAITALQHG